MLVRIGITKNEFAEILKIKVNYKNEKYVNCFNLNCKGNINCNECIFAQAKYTIKELEKLNRIK